jgi:hypothetical protein
VREDGKTEVDDKLAVEHKEVASLFTELCHKLDALSNFHFTPRPASIDLTVRAHVPAISVEEIIPAAVSDAQLVAPQDVYASKAQGLPVAATETSREEKKRNHRHKKSLVHKQKRAEVLEEKADENRMRALGLGQPDDKEVGRRGGRDGKGLSNREVASIKAALGAKNVVNAHGAEGEGIKYTKSSDFFAKMAVKDRNPHPAKKQKTKQEGSSSKFKM